ncbi:MAG: ribosome-binding factor A [Candidatus Moranbacteria bacterium]|nr:ribosome-binding factor A [Candidatus Moranbacteria bacterium]
MSHRLEKINKLIKRQVAEIITRELDLKPGVFVTVAKVDTTPDLRYTRIFVSIFPEREANYVMETLKKEMYRLQGVLNKKLSTKPLPRIEFQLDKTESKADEVEKILIELE